MCAALDKRPSSIKCTGCGVNTLVKQLTRFVNFCTATDAAAISPVLLLLKSPKSCRQEGPVDSVYASVSVALQRIHTVHVGCFMEYTHRYCRQEALVDSVDRTRFAYSVYRQGIKADCTSPLLLLVKSPNSCRGRESFFNL